MLRLSLYLAFRQLVHRSGSAVGALAGVCVAIVLMFMQLGFRNALYDSAVGIPLALDADIFLASNQYVSLAFSPPWLPRSALSQAQSVEGVVTARPFYAFSGQLRSPRSGANMSSWILGFDPDQPVFTLPSINDRLHLLRLSNAALMDRLSRYDYTLLRDAVDAGGEPTVGVHLPGASLSPTVRIAGLFTLGPSFTIDGMIVVSDLTMYRLLGLPLDRVSLGLLRLAPGADPQAVKQRLQAVVGDRVRIFTRQEFIDGEKAFYATRTPIGMIFNIGLLVGVVVGVVFISQVLHGIIDANLKEYAVLVAMGYKRYFFRLIVFEIAAVIAVATFIPSLLLSVGLYAAAGAATKLPLVLRPEAALGVFVLVVVMGNVASLFAMRKLKRANPLDLFS